MERGVEPVGKVRPSGKGSKARPLPLMSIPDVEEEEEEEGVEDDDGPADMADAEPELQSSRVSQSFTGRE